MKQLIIYLILLIFSTSAIADFTLIVPQKPGGGTSIWASIVAEQLSIALNEKVSVKHLPGARDIFGFNKFHNKAQYNDNIIMVSHGGNAVSFLQEKVDYNYKNYDSIGLMNLNIIVAQQLTNFKLNNDSILFAAGSGMVPEAFAITMIICGPMNSVDEYIECFNKNIIWVKGMDAGERRLAFIRGELSATRENPAAFKKYVQPMIDKNDATIFFHHGILNVITGKHDDDPNYPGYQFEILYNNIWNEKPQGDFYDAYKLVKSFRDGMQKALWVRRDNPNTKRLRNALNKIATDPILNLKIKERVGNYEWIIGKDGNIHRDFLMSLITKNSLQTLIKFNNAALGLASIYKKDLILN